MWLFEVGSEIYKWFQYIAPGVMIIIAIVVAASIKRGLSSFIQDIKDLANSKWGVFLFIVIAYVLIVFWIEVSSTVGNL